MEKQKNEEFKNNIASDFLVGLLLLILIASVIEVGFFIYVYLNADKVSCNFLWCTFTSEKMISSSSSETCIINGEKVNCSDFHSSFPDKHFYNNGIYEVNGVCPGINSNETVEDCIKKVDNKNDKQ